MAFALREPIITPCARCAKNAGPRRAHFSIQTAVVPLFNLTTELSTDFPTAFRAILPTALGAIRDAIGLPHTFDISARLTLPRRLPVLKRSASNVTLENACDRLAANIFDNLSERHRSFLPTCSSIALLVNVKQGLIPHICRRFTSQDPGSFLGVHSFLEHVSYTALRSKVKTTGLKTFTESPDCLQMSEKIFLHKTATTPFLICIE